MMANIGLAGSFDWSIRTTRAGNPSKKCIAETWRESASAIDEGHPYTHVCWVCYEAQWILTKIVMLLLGIRR